MNLPSIVHSPLPGHYSAPAASQRPASFAAVSPTFTSHPPAPPPSPPVEDNARCSLPSISTLLVYADSAPAQGRQPQSSQAQRANLPPTPPMRPDSMFEEGSSPTVSCASSPQNGYYSAPQNHRNSYPPALGQKSYPLPIDPAYSATLPHSVYGQSLEKPGMMVPLLTTSPSNSNPWHHHHHTSPASQGAFPQSQDRYICPTCNKAFSRPSSLRIHSHSHTGEKPFKCPHHGCGKAFSVRSNMKRHERGCHQ